MLEYPPSSVNPTDCFSHLQSQPLSTGGPNEGTRLLLGTDITGVPAAIVGNPNSATWTDQNLVNTSTTTQYLLAAGAAAFDPNCVSPDAGGYTSIGLPVSTTGQCGPSVGLKCPAGECCANNSAPNGGTCGNTSDFCNQFVSNCNPSFGSGCQMPVSSDGNCGLNYGTQCPPGECCDLSSGLCGTTSEYCDGVGCNPYFGSGCQLPVSTTGQCGPNNGFQCPAGMCCSEVTLQCGFGDAYCDACIPGYGSGCASTGGPVQSSVCSTLGTFASCGTGCGLDPPREELWADANGGYFGTYPTSQWYPAGSTVWQQLRGTLSNMIPAAATGVAADTMALLSDPSSVINMGTYAVAFNMTDRTYWITNATATANMQQLMMGTYTVGLESFLGTTVQSVQLNCNGGGGNCPLPSSASPSPGMYQGCGQGASSIPYGPALSINEQSPETYGPSLNDTMPFEPSITFPGAQCFAASNPTNKNGPGTIGRGSGTSGTSL